MIRIGSKAYYKNQRVTVKDIYGSNAVIEVSKGCQITVELQELNPIIQEGHKDDNHLISNLNS